MNIEDDKAHKLEILKLIVDYMKHLTTLSTGSIIVLGTFLEKLFQRPYWKPLVVCSFIGFVAAIVAAMIANFYVIMEESPMGPTGGVDEKIAVGSVAVAVLGFLFGVFCLALFAVRNFLA